jgi:hypothetical protein
LILFRQALTLNEPQNYSTLGSTCKKVNGKEDPEGMALQERRSPENKRKVSKRLSLWAMAKGRPSGLQGLATMNEAGKVIFRMAYSHGEATGDETKGNPLFTPISRP